MWVVVRFAKFPANFPERFDAGKYWPSDVRLFIACAPLCIVIFMVVHGYSCCRTISDRDFVLRRPFHSLERTITSHTIRYVSAFVLWINKIVFFVYGLYIDLNDCDCLLFGKMRVMNFLYLKTIEIIPYFFYRNKLYF